MIESGIIEANDFLLESPNKMWENPMYSTSFMRSSEDIYDFTSPSLSLMQLLVPTKETDIHLRGCTILNSSSLLYEKSREYLNSDLLVFPNIINDINRDISNLELKISSELKFLSEQEAKWTSLSAFAEEYKKELEISDEELWYEFGHELNTIAYEIHSINQTKQLIFASKDYLKRAKKIICSLLIGIKFNHRCELRQQIAFSTKNLDDEHNSEVKIFNKSTFTKSDFVFNEKKIIIKQLRLACKEDLPKEQKDALREAIKKLQKEKGEFDPAWIALILQALGIGIEIFHKGP